MVRLTDYYHRLVDHLLHVDRAADVLDFVVNQFHDPPADDDAAALGDAVL